MVYSLNSWIQVMCKKIREPKLYCARLFGKPFCLCFWLKRIFQLTAHFGSHVNQLSRSFWSYLLDSNLVPDSIMASCILIEFIVKLNYMSGWIEKNVCKRTIWDGSFQWPNLFERNLKWAELPITPASSLGTNSLLPFSILSHRFYLLVPYNISIIALCQILINKTKSFVYISYKCENFLYLNDSYTIRAETSLIWISICPSPSEMLANVFCLLSLGKQLHRLQWNFSPYSIHAWDCYSLLGTVIQFWK